MRAVPEYNGTGPIWADTGVSRVDDHLEQENGSLAASGPECVCQSVLIRIVELIEAGSAEELSSRIEALT